MKKVNLFLINVIVAILFLSSCEKDDNNKPNNPNTPNDEEVDNNTPKTIDVELKYNNDSNFVYYSFNDNKIVSISNSDAKNNANWDIAFLGCNGKTNSGTSGKENVAIIRTDCDDFESIQSAEPFINSEYWETDALTETPLVLTKNTPTSKIESLNPLLQSFGWFTLYTEPTEIVVKEEVFIIRTTENKYAKIQFSQPKEIGTVKFKWQFISETENNESSIEIYKIPKIIVTETDKGILYLGDKKLSDILVKLKNKDITKLTIINKTINQTDIDFIKSKKGQNYFEGIKSVKTLDLTHSTLSLYGDDYGFKDSKNITNILMPKNLTSIGYGRLGYSNIETVTFTGNQLEELGEGTFSFSNKIKKLDLPTSLAIIGKQCFSVMQGLQEVEIPEKVNLIPDQCFAYDYALQSVTFKGKIRTLGNGAFSYCKKLTKIKFTQTEPPTYNEGEYPFMEDDLLNNADGTPRVFFHIPQGTTNAYQKAWKFTNDGDEKYFIEY